MVENLQKENQLYLECNHELKQLLEAITIQMFKNKPTDIVIIRI